MATIAKIITVINPIWKFISSKGLVFVLLYLLVYAITHPEKSERWGSWIYKSLRWTGHKMKSRWIASDIQARIDSFAKVIGDEVKDLMPYGVRINWVKETDKDTFIRNGEVVVRMRYHDNQHRNFVAATLAYLSKGMLPRSRHYIDEGIMKSIDFTLAKKIFLREKQNEALFHFQEEVLDPTFQTEPQIRQYCNTVENLDERGLFTKILLREFHDVGILMYPRTADEAVIEETKQFVTFLNGIATKGRGEDVDLAFNRKTIRVSIIIVARLEVIDSYGSQPYLSRITNCLQEGIETIYISAWGRSNVEAAKKIAERSCQYNQMLRQVDRKEYKIFFNDRAATAVCITLKTTHRLMFERKKEERSQEEPLESSKRE